MNKIIPIIRVFSSLYSSTMIEKFEKDGYVVYFDAVHGGDKEWLHQYYKDSQCRGIKKDFGWYFTGDEFPDLVISFDCDYVLKQEDWELLLYYVGGLVDESSMDPDKVHKFDLLFDKPTKLKAHTFSENGVHRFIPPEYVVLEAPYEFRYKVDTEMDVAIYEVIRPGSLPFTVVVWPFSEKGHEYLFTDICISNDWCRNYRESRYDFWFMQQLWMELIGGELSTELFDVLLEKRTSRCYPTKDNVQPMPEPIVYRRKLENVEMVLRERGFGQRVKV